MKDVAHLVGITPYQDGFFHDILQRGCHFIDVLIEHVEFFIARKGFTLWGVPHGRIRHAGFFHALFVLALPFVLCRVTRLHCPQPRR